VQTTMQPEPKSASIAQVMIAALQAMRPHQWIKNTLLFAGLIFTANFTNPPLIGMASLAFIAFCLISSGVYVFNDLRDVERDRAHPTKRDRPIASGRLPLSVARVMPVFCWVLGLGGAFRLDTGFGVVALLYWTLTMSYTLGFKGTVILDVVAIALGFVLRAIAGAVVIHVMISPWLMICTFFLALFLGFAKRRHELLTLGEEGSTHREALAEYTVNYLEHLLTISIALTIQSYSIYTVLSETAKNHPDLWYTLPFVVYALLRYYYLIHRHDMGGEPERIIVSDKHILLSILLWGVTVAWIMAR
jgi:4-hydroxybenzoate polyprenyltransferase